MKALLLTAQKTLKLEDVVTPLPESDEVLIDVELVSVGGSEYLGFQNPGIRPLPNIMGHGVVGKTPEGKRVAVYPLKGCGDCTYCDANLRQLCADWTLIGVHSDGGFAEQLVVPENALVELPADLAWEQAVFSEPFANSVNAWERSGAHAETSVAVIGAGGIGLGLVVCAKEAGCTSTKVIELSSTRRSAALELGATYASNTATGEFDIVFDTVGSQATRATAIQLTRPGGSCVLVGFAAQTLELDASAFIRQQKHLLGSFVYSKEQFKKAIHLTRHCPKHWVKSLSFLEVEPQLRSYLAGDFRILKAALRPSS